MPKNNKNKVIGVCLSERSDNTKLIEEAYNLSEQNNFKWYAIFIENENQFIDLISEQRISNAIEQAKALGAEILRIPSSSTIEGILTLTELNKITNLVIGKRKKPFFESIIRPSLATKLLKEDTNFEINVINVKQDEAKSNKISFSSKLKSISYSFLLIGLITLITDLIQEVLPEYKFNAALYNVSMIYLLSIVFIALRYGVLPAILSSIVSYILYNYFFVVPFYSFSVDSTAEIINLFLFLFSAILAALVTDFYRKASDNLKSKEESSRALYVLGKDILGMNDIDEAIDNIGYDIQNILSSEIRIGFLKGTKSFDVKFPIGSHLSKEEKKKALESIEDRKVMTENKVYFPIYNYEGNIGILVVDDSNVNKNLAQSVCYQIALTVERIKLLRSSEKASINLEKEKIRSALLSSVSHDLKTPLVSIIGSLSSIRHIKDSLSSEEIDELIKTSIEEAERLNQSISNILDITKIESGNVKLNLNWNHLDNIIFESLEKNKSILGSNKIDIISSNRKFKILVDEALFLKVISNLVENSLKYSGAKSKISIGYELKSKNLEFFVSDNGKGINKKNREKLFDKFYRIEQKDSKIAGAGLGMHICKAICDLHNFKIEIRDNKDKKGIKFVILINEYREILDK